MEDKSKNSNFISKEFIDVFLFLSQDSVGDMLDAYLSIPVYINESSKGIDKFNILW